MSETHKQVLRAANLAIAKGDYEGFLKHCTDTHSGTSLATAP